jgi:tetratricopeptide (TPR) repeat protein
MAVPLPHERANADTVEIQRESKRAVELIRNGDYAEAEKVYAALNRRFPNNAFILYELGRCRFWQQKYRLAHDVLTRAIALAPNDPYPISVLGGVYHAQGKLDEAIAAYRRALALKPGDNFLNRCLQRAEADRAWLTHPPRFDKPKKEHISA